MTIKEQLEEIRTILRNAEKEFNQSRTSDFVLYYQAIEKIAEQKKVTGEHVWRYDTESAFTDLARIGTIRLICQKTIEDLKQEDLHHIQVFLRCMTSVKLALFVSLKCRSYVRRALMHDLYFPQMLRTITV